VARNKSYRTGDGTKAAFLVDQHWASETERTLDSFPSPKGDDREERNFGQASSVTESACILPSRKAVGFLQNPSPADFDVEVKAYCAVRERFSEVAVVMEGPC